MFEKKGASIRKKQLKNLKWLKEKTDEKNWWVVVSDMGTRETMGFTLKGEHTIKEAINDILDDHSEYAEIEHLIPYNLAHVCPKCNTLIENTDIFEICDECKQEVVEKRELSTKTEDEVREHFEKQREEALEYLRELKEKISENKDNEKLN